MPDELTRCLHVAIRAAKLAGRHQLASVGTDLGVASKGGRTGLVTRVDRECEELIVECIGSEFPDHALLGEEGGRTGAPSDYTWIIDPLDGTGNYAHGYPFYGVSIALSVAGVLEVGVILDSVREELFTARRGAGACANGAPIAVSKTAELGQCLISTGFAELNNLAAFARATRQVRGVRVPGPAAINLAAVACGRLDAFWEPGVKPWDIAAGLVIVREAGGSATDGRGNSATPDTDMLVCSNGRLHGAILGLLASGP